MRFVTALLALLSFWSASAAELTYEYQNCWDGGYYVECPAQLSSMAVPLTGTDTATLNVTTDQPGGVLHCLVNQNATETDLDAIRRGQSQVVSSAGVQSMTFSNLGDGVSYFAHCLHDYAGVPNSFAPDGSIYIASVGFQTDSIVVPGGVNAARISAALLGKTVPFAYSTPQDPITSGVINVAANDGPGLLAAVRTPNRVVNVPAGTYTTSISGIADNVDIVMNPGATVVGDVGIGGVDNFRWTGGSVQGRYFEGEAGGTMSDVLLQNIDIDIDSSDFNNGNTFNGANARVAWLDITMNVRTNQIGSWGIYTAPNAGNSDWIFSNVNIDAGNIPFNSNPAAFRLQGINRLIIVDSLLQGQEPTSNNRTAWRLHSIVDGYFDNVASVGNVLWNYSNTVGGTDITNAVIKDSVRYSSSAANQLFATVGSSSGVNSMEGNTVFRVGSSDGSLSTSPFVDDGGNLLRAWDGLSFPDSSLYGANLAPLEPYDLAAGGTRTIPFSYEWPEEPITTRSVSVVTAAQFNAEAAVSGTQITVTASFTGDVIINADDIDVVMDNSLTINGTLRIGSFSSSSRMDRIRWTGGNFNNSGILVFATNDLMFDDIYFRTDSTVASEGLNDFRGNNSNAALAGIDRFAIINTTIEHDNAINTDSYAFYAAGRNDPQNLIFANVRIDNVGGAQTTRLLNQNKHIVVDSVFNGSNQGSNGYRLHGDGVVSSDEVYFADSTIVNIFKIDGTAANGGPNVTNGVFERITRYTGDAAFAYGEFNTFGNQATVNDSPVYHPAGDGVTEAGLAAGLTGSNNIRQPWDGSTLPDFSGVGAVR